MTSGGKLCALALVVSLLAPGIRPALADDAAPPSVAAARKHFEKARAFYAQGAYREAIAEFEQAHALDPSAKDLVFDLGVVHEKLADIDDALTWFRLYLTMSLTPQEHDRADAYVRRLEGAKKELAAKQSAAASAPGSSATAPSPTPPPAPAAASPRGRIDAWTLGAAGVAAAGLVVGTVFGVKAIVDKPPSTYVTGQAGSYQDLVNRTNQAHTAAMVADVGFGVALVGAAATAILFFARSKDDAPQSADAPTVSAAPLLHGGGGAVFVQGSF